MGWFPRGSGFEKISSLPCKGREGTIELHSPNGTHGICLAVDLNKKILKMNPEKTTEIAVIIVSAIAFAAFIIGVVVIRRILFPEKPVEVILPDPVVIPESMKEAEAVLNSELIERSRVAYLYKAFWACINRDDLEFRITYLVIAASVIPVIAITAGTFLVLIVSSPPPREQGS